MQIFMYTYISIKDLVQLEQLKYVTTQYDTLIFHTYFQFQYSFLSGLSFTLYYFYCTLFYTFSLPFYTFSLPLNICTNCIILFFNFLCTFIYIVNFKNIIYRKPYNFFRKVSFLQYITQIKTEMKTITIFLGQFTKCSSGD